MKDRDKISRIRGIERVERFIKCQNYFLSVALYYLLCLVVVWLMIYILIIRGERRKIKVIKKTTLIKYLDILPDREKDILILRFGLEGGEPQSLRKVAKKYKITAERIRQIQNVALDMIEKEKNKIRLTNNEINLIKTILKDYSYNESKVLRKVALIIGKLNSMYYGKK